MCFCVCVYVNKWHRWSTLKSLDFLLKCLDYFLFYLSTTCFARVFCVWSNRRGRINMTHLKCALSTNYQLLLQARFISRCCFFIVIFMNLALICNASFNLFPWHFIFILNYVDFGLLFLCVNLLLVSPSEIRLTETERYTQFVCILLCIRAFRFAGFFLFSFAWFCVSNSLFIHVN